MISNNIANLALNGTKRRTAKKTFIGSSYMPRMLNDTNSVGSRKIGIIGCNCK